jgi:hypothetical protein
MYGFKELTKAQTGSEQKDNDKTRITDIIA